MCSKLIIFKHIWRDYRIVLKNAIKKMIWFYLKKQRWFSYNLYIQKIQIFFNKKMSSFKTVQFLKHDYY